MTSKSISINDIEHIDIEMYADIIIDCKKRGIQVKAESNIIDLININITDGQLTIDQKKWIQPSEAIEILIGAPDLESVHQGTHDQATILNVQSDTLILEAELGQLNVFGQTDYLEVSSDHGIVKADGLVTKNARLKIRDDGKIIANVLDEAFCRINPDGQLTFTNRPSICEGCDPFTPKEIVDTKWIDLKIKNNTWGRKHLEVVGPKPNGRKFGYGFPMMPGQVKKERWTVGTKIYRKSAIGKRVLLVTLTAENENTTVKLF